MCNKVSYPSKQDALKDAWHIKNNAKKYSKNHRGGNDKTKKLRPYYCTFCDMWHLTSTKKR